MVWSFLKKVMTLLAKLLRSKMGVEETAYSSNIVTERIIDSGKFTLNKTSSATTYVESIPHKFDRPHFIEVIVSPDGITFYPPLKFGGSSSIKTQMWMNSSRYFFAMDDTSSSPTTVFFRYFVYWNDLDE